MLVRFDSSVASNMLHPNAAGGKNLSDKECAVTNRGIFFGAEDGDLEFCSALFEAGKTGLKLGGGGELVVENVTLGVVELVTVGAAAEFAAQVEIFEIVLRKRLFESLAVEVRGVVRIRIGADVHEDFH